ncbi:unnamed protein product [Ceratitis capitata]|uniref:(Mediterranean fruit fly) hypothetical protein n=1 Tax=Ceratitis capitata TaxID=7213 RepID=A0A811V7E0_CERCA|nr:unnamed protein product [Ceratitis capitata]
MSSEVQGPNIAEWQAQQQHQEYQGGKSGFGLGHSDSVATIVDGMKWLFSFHEGAIASYNNVFEGLAEHFSGRGGDGEGITLEETDMGYSNKGSHLDDYSNSSSEIAHSADGLHGIHNSGDYHDCSFSPSPSPSVGDDHGYELSV